MTADRQPPPGDDVVDDLHHRAATQLLASSPSLASPWWLSAWRLIDACESAILAASADLPAADRSEAVGRLARLFTNDGYGSESVRLLPSEAMRRTLSTGPQPVAHPSGGSSAGTFHPSDGLDRLHGALGALIELTTGVLRCHPDGIPVFGDAPADLDQRSTDGTADRRPSGGQEQAGRHEALLALIELAAQAERDAPAEPSSASHEPYELYGRRAAFYDRLYARAGLYAAHADALEAALGRRPDRVLDLCCGTGILLAELERRGIEAIGVDHSQAMLAIAASRVSRDRLIHADVRDLRVDADFDVVSCMFGALHLLDGPADIEETLATTRAHLRPEGVAVFDVIDGALLPTSISARRSGQLDVFKAWAPGRGRRGADQYLLAALDLETSEGFIEVQDYRYCAPDRIRRLALQSGFRSATIVRRGEPGAVAHSARGLDQVLLVCQP